MTEVYVSSSTASNATALPLSALVTTQREVFSWLATSPVTVARAEPGRTRAEGQPIAPPDELARYQDHWVAVRDGRVTASRESLGEVLDWIDEHGGGTSFAVLRVPSSEDTI